MVGRVAPHQVQRVAVDARGRDELAHGRRRPVGAPHHGQQQPGVAGVEDPTEHHGEAPLVLALAAEAHQGGELVPQGGVQPGRIVEGDGVAVLLDAVVGLAEPLHVAARQGEGLDTHHRLVTEVDVVHPRVAVDRQPVLARTHHRRHPAVVVGEPPERPPDLLALVAGSDGIGRDQADATVDGIGHQAVPVEEPPLVGAQREVVEGGDAVAAHDVPGPELGGAAGGQPAVDHRAGEQEQRDGDQRQADDQQGRGQEPVGPLGQGDGLDARPSARPPPTGPSTMEGGCACGDGRCW